MAKSPAWQRAEGKNPEGGLNAKGRAAYNRANPGKPGLKAPQPEGGPRRDSFCARMKGMKKKLTSAKTANDPNSRINKSLRAWNCAEGGMIKKYAKGGGISTEMGKGKPIDLRMAQMDKYLKDPSMELVIGPTGKFQFRERKSSVPAAPTPKTPKPNPNAVAGAGTGNKTPRGGGMKALETRAERDTRANRLPGSSSGIPRPKPLPLSAFSSTGKRQTARPLDTPTKIKAPKVTGLDDYSSPRVKRNREIAEELLATTATGLGLGAAGKLASRGIGKAAERLANKPLTQSQLSQMLGRARPGEVVPSEAELGASRFMDAFRSMGLKRGGMTKAKPAKVATVMREFKAGKLHSGKSKKIVRNPKQAVAIALSEGRKAARRK